MDTRQVGGGGSTSDKPAGACAVRAITPKQLILNSRNLPPPPTPWGELDDPVGRSGGGWVVAGGSRGGQSALAMVVRSEQVVVAATVVGGERSDRRILVLQRDPPLVLTPDSFRAAKEVPERSVAFFQLRVGRALDPDAA